MPPSGMSPPPKAPVGAQILPTGGQVVFAQARIGQSGTQMTIDQASSKAIPHWQGGDIDSGAQSPV